MNASDRVDWPVKRNNWQNTKESVASILLSDYTKQTPFSTQIWEPAPSKLEGKVSINRNAAVTDSLREKAPKLLHTAPIFPAINFSILGQFEPFFSSETIPALGAAEWPPVEQWMGSREASLIFGGLGGPTAPGESGEREVSTTSFPDDASQEFWIVLSSLILKEPEKSNFLGKGDVLNFQVSILGTEEQD